MERSIELKRKSVITKKISTVLDRYEGNLAVLIAEENEWELQIPRQWLENMAKVNDVVTLELRINEKQQQKLQAEVDELRNQLDKLSN